MEKHFGKPDCAGAAAKVRDCEGWGLKATSVGPADVFFTVAAEMRRRHTGSMFWQRDRQAITLI